MLVRVSTLSQVGGVSRVPAEWGSLTDAQRGAGSLAGFKRGSRGGFLAGYRANVCVRPGCYVCQGGGGQGAVP